MGSRQTVARVVHGAAWLAGTSVRRTRRIGGMRILMLHGVGGRDYPAEALDAQLAWLARDFDVVPLETVVRVLRGGGGGTGREVAITFDDGLANHARVVAPLLARHGTPATFFVCPGLLGTSRWLWNHEARARLGRLEHEIAVRLARALGAPDTAAVADPVEAAVTRMKALPPGERASAEERIRAVTSTFEPTRSERQASDVMTWEELLALDPALVTVGAHTVTHPILTTLDADDLVREVTDSRRQLEARLGRPVRWFCYPNGAEDPRVRAVAADVFEAAVTVEPGVVRRGADRHRLPRLGAVPGRAALAWRMFRP